MTSKSPSDPPPPASTPPPLPPLPLHPPFNTGPTVTGLNTELSTSYQHNLPSSTTESFPLNPSNFDPNIQFQEQGMDEGRYDLTNTQSQTQSNPSTETNNPAPEFDWIKYFFDEYQEQDIQIQDQSSPSTEIHEQPGFENNPNLAETDDPIQNASELNNHNRRSKRQTYTDGYNWRRTGNYTLKSGNKRTYYSCKHPNCLTKKVVELKASTDGGLVIIYNSKHNHPNPQSTEPALSSSVRRNSISDHPVNPIGTQDNQITIRDDESDSIRSGGEQFAEDESQSKRLRRMDTGTSSQPVYQPYNAGIMSVDPSVGPSQPIYSPNDVGTMPFNPGYESSQLTNQLYNMSIMPINHGGRSSQPMFPANYVSTQLVNSDASYNMTNVPVNQGGWSSQTIYPSNNLSTQQVNPGAFYNMSNMPVNHGGWSSQSVYCPHNVSTQLVNPGAPYNMSNVPVNRGGLSSQTIYSPYNVNTQLVNLGGGPSGHTYPLFNLGTVPVNPSGWSSQHQAYNMSIVPIVGPSQHTTSLNNTRTMSFNQPSFSYQDPTHSMHNPNHSTNSMSMSRSQGQGGSGSRPFR